MGAAGAGVASVLLLSASVAFDPGDNLLLTLLGQRTYADLRDESISTKPSGWTGRDETAAAEAAQVKGAVLEDMDFRNAAADGAFLLKTKLASANLTGADLSGANGVTQEQLN
jgi:uncharacterized protein YjbI with pentapeptide repeats